MREIMPEGQAAFKYGLLISRTTVTLAKYRNLRGYKLDSEDIEILREATEFIEKISAGEKLLSGERSAFSPSPSNVKLLDYAIETSELLHEMRSPEVRTHFLSIKNTISNIVRRPRKRLQEDEINRIYGFFSSLSELFVGELQPILELKMSNFSYP
jgi:hypothetical protein